MTMNEKSYIFTYATGDVTRLFAHQIVTAANYDMYLPHQRF